MSVIVYSPIGHGPAPHLLHGAGVLGVADTAANTLIARSV